MLNIFKGFGLGKVWMMIYRINLWGSGGGYFFGYYGMSYGYSGGSGFEEGLSEYCLF